MILVLHLWEKLEIVRVHYWSKSMNILIFMLAAISLILDLATIENKKICINFVFIFYIFGIRVLVTDVDSRCKQNYPYHNLR